MIFKLLCIDLLEALGNKIISKDYLPYIIPETYHLRQ